MHLNNPCAKFKYQPGQMKVERWLVIQFATKYICRLNTHICKLVFLSGKVEFFLCVYTVYLNLSCWVVCFSSD
jgi:hypothetical protein